jgi:argininosuccinate lyase
MDDLLKALQQGYSKDYQELIRKYFDALQKTELQNK